MKEIGQRMQRHLGKPEAMLAGQYCVVTTESTAGFDTTVFVACPNCGSRDALDSTFTVLPYSGLVTPRWRCRGCALVERLSLDAWGDA